MLVKLWVAPSVVTTTELSSPSRWLATTEQHHHRGVLHCSRWYFLGAVS